MSTQLRGAGLLLILLGGVWWLYTSTTYGYRTPPIWPGPVAVMLGLVLAGGSLIRRST